MNRMYKDNSEQNVFYVNVHFNELKVERDEIISSLGYGSREIDSHFSEMIDDALSQAKKLTDMQAGYGVFTVNDVKVKTGEITINNLLFKTDKIVASQLNKSELAAMFVCSIGKELEKWIKETEKNGDPTKSYIADTVASSVTEALADYLHDLIGDKMHQEGLNITNRYSPGYCNWSVSEQQKLFSLLPEKFCGVELTNSSLMIPIKSISGIIGIGRDVKRSDYLCDTCGVKDCTYRSIRIRDTERKKIK
jgi:hypothetical protein